MNVLIEGLGSIGRKHLTVLKELNSTVKIFALRSKESNDEEGIFNIYSHNDIPKNIDFAIISTPTISHKEAIKKLLLKKIPLFIEKPVLHKIDKETPQILEQINESKLFTYVGCNLRFHPCINYLKDYIDQKNPYINEVNIYCGSYLPNWRPNRDFREVYSARPELGGGVHLDLIHEIDYAYYILGAPNNVSSFFRSKSSLNIDAIDYAHYLLEYPSFAATITLNYFRTQAKRTIEVVFDNDILTVDLIASKITDKNGQVVFEEKTDQQKTLKLQMEYFLGAFKTNNISLNSFEESLTVLKICLNQ